MKLSLFALSVLLLSRPVSAAVVYSGSQDLAVSSLDLEGIYINFDTGAIAYLYPTDFEDSPWINITLGGNGIFNGEVVQPIAVSVGVYDPLLETDHYVNLAPGTTIDVSSAFVVNGYGSEHHLGDVGDPGKFVLDQAGILGFAFQNVAGGDTFYGWLRFTPSNGGSGTIVDWAYEDTAGAAIQAGVVPEPSSFALLFCGAAAMASIRRRKA